MRLSGDKRKQRKTGGRRPGPRLSRRLVVATGGAAVLLAAAGWSVQSGLLARGIEDARLRIVNAAAEGGLRVGEVLVEGRQRSDAGALLAALEVERGSPMLSFDPHAARQRLEALPWVRSATVERRLPDTVYVNLAERQPMALWQLEGRLQVIDSEGTVIAGARPDRFAALTLVVGEDAPEHVSSLIRMLAGEPELARQVVAAVRVGGRRWNLKLKEDIEVKLPELAAETAWARLARLVRDDKLFEHDVALVDLRLPDRMVVRTTRGELPALPNETGGRST